MRNFRFRKFPVYQQAREIRLQMHSLLKHLPAEEKFALSSQIRRAMDSVILNIAEGSNRKTDLDFSRFLNQSLGSLDEVVACLDLAIDSNYVRPAKVEPLLNELDELSSSLHAFYRKLVGDAK